MKSGDSLQKSAQEPTLGIYVSVPFCQAKCSYCNFASGVFSRDRMSTYVSRLLSDIRGARERAFGLSAAPVSELVNTIYLGGGTPSLLPVSELKRVFAALRDEFTVAHGAEVTMECAPGQVSDELLASFAEVGVSRVSLGVQSFVDREARAVGRLHTRSEVLGDIARLRDAGIQRINIDLIAGLPYQGIESWDDSLDVLLESGTTHASVYLLEVDDDSRLGREVSAGGVRYHAHHVPNDDLMAEMYERACEQLDGAGLLQYEISNFARPGAESEHDLKYWSRSPYLGFGLDAHSMLPAGLDGVTAIRMSESDDLHAYTSGGVRPEVLHISPKDALEEACFLGLRRNCGIDLNELCRHYGTELVADIQETIHDLCKDGMLEVQGSSVKLSARGRLLSNEVFARLIDIESEHVKA